MTTENAADFLAAGAAGVGWVKILFSADLKAERFDLLRERAAKMVKEAPGGS